MMIVASRFTNEISSREWREYFLNENLQKKKKKKNVKRGGETHGSTNFRITFTYSSLQIYRSLTLELYRGLKHEISIQKIRK